jgi:hypothetical protein
MRTPCDLEKFGGDFDIIEWIFEDLDPALTGIILCPGVASQSVTLFACMPRT